MNRLKNKHGQLIFSILGKNHCDDEAMRIAPWVPQPQNELDSQLYIQLLLKWATGQAIRPGAWTPISGCGIN